MHDEWRVGLVTSYRVLVLPLFFAAAGFATGAYLRHLADAVAASLGYLAALSIPVLVCTALAWPLGAPFFKARGKLLPAAAAFAGALLVIVWLMISFRMEH